MKKKILILGLGYVGITLFAALMKKNKKHELYGVDNSKELIKNLKNKKFITYEKNLLNIFNKYKNNNIFFDSQINTNIKYDIIIICVGTPIKSNKKINDKFLFDAVKDISKSLNNNSLIIIRSTVKVGTTKNIYKFLNKITKVKFHIAFCPERTIEGNAIEEITKLPQLVGCIDKNTKKLTSDFFKILTQKIIFFETFEEPELIKLLDNSYRDSKFAFANQVAIICDQLNLNAIKIIQKANKNFSRNAIPLPGPVGGPCLSKDPYILDQSTKQNSSLITQSRKINEKYVELFSNKIIKFSKKLNEKNINFSIIGISFKGKPDTNDIRDSTALKIIEKIKSEFPRSKIYIFDKFVEARKIKNLDCIKINEIDDCFKKNVCIIHGNNNYIKSIDINKKLNNNTKVFVFDFWDNFSNIINPLNKKKYSGLGI